MRKFIFLVGLGLASSGALAAGNPAAGQEKAAPCAACHGADGNSATPSFPKLAGQHADYIVESLNQYQNGKRKNAIMVGQAANLSEQDIEDLAAYYAAQKGLYTPKYEQQ